MFASGLCPNHNCPIEFSFSNDVCINCKFYRKMKENDVEKKVEPIVAFSFMVEVIEKPNCEKQFIVRVQTAQGMAVSCCGTIKEFNQFIASL